MNYPQRSRRKRSSLHHGLMAPQMVSKSIKSAAPDATRGSIPALVNTSEPDPSREEDGTVLSRKHVYRPRGRSIRPRLHRAFAIISVAFALLWGFAIARNNTITAVHPHSPDRTEKSAQSTIARRLSQLPHASTTDRDLQSSDPLRKKCSFLARQLCGKCSSSYKKLVKKGDCKKKKKKKKCKERFKSCMFGKSNPLARKFDSDCADRLLVKWPIQNIFGREKFWAIFGRRKFDYRKMRLVDWCRPPKARRPRAEDNDECGEEVEYFAEMEVELDLYCPIDEDNLPKQSQKERSEMEEGFLLWARSDSACTFLDECEQIRYETSTIQELVPGEDCCPIYENKGIPCPTTSRFLLEEEYDGSFESFEAIMTRSLQRVRKTKVRKRFSGRCRSRTKKCRRKQKRRRLEVGFDSVSGSMTIPLGDGGKVGTYSLRSGGSSDSGVKKNKQNALVQPTHVVRYLQNNGEIDIGDLTPAECEALTLEGSIRLQNPDAFRTIGATEETQYVEYPCEDLSSFECNSRLGGYICCGVGSCKCDIGSNSRCDKGTTFGTQQRQCYLNSDGLQGNIASRQDNLCCELLAGPPLSYRYDCSASVCGPLPTAQCWRQPWIKTVNSAGSFVIDVNFDIVNVCSATLANRNSIETMVANVIDKYVKSLIEYGGCSRSNEIENGVTVSSVTVVANTSNCPANSRRLGVPKGTASRELQSVTSCIDSATGQVEPSVTFSARVTGRFRTFQPRTFPIEKQIVYDGFSAPAPTPGDPNVCSCDSLICKDVREALINTAGANVQNAGVTTTGIEIETPPTPVPPTPVPPTPVPPTVTPPTPVPPTPVPPTLVPPTSTVAPPTPMPPTPVPPTSTVAPPTPIPPTPAPTTSPTSTPSAGPSLGPTAQPSDVPSDVPSVSPSVSFYPSVSAAPTQDFGLGRPCQSAAECVSLPPFDDEDINTYLNIGNMNITCDVKDKGDANVNVCCIPDGAPCSSKIQTADKDPYKGCCNQGCSGGVEGICG